MSRLYKILFFLVVPFFMAGCAGKPDISISDLQANGDPVFNLDGTVDVPIRIVLENHGATPSRDFRITAQSLNVASGLEGHITLPLAISGGEAQDYPVIPPISGEGASTVDGIVTFPSTDPAQFIVWIEADTCKDGELQSPRDYCRVDESNEENNKTEPLIIPISVP